ncbi:hypothetical protein ACFVAV_18185 [Nocardia sp. NPDC057663]|uniref:DUF7691 family protein n=1 Tax=Nocardia sp. NPDC057663 TaxID=3346201 RepID=UPI0036735218
MSQILHVYSLDLAELQAVIGSEDEKLLNRILARGRDHLLVTLPSEDQDGHVERNKDALRAILAGGLFEEQLAEHYVEALELICDELASDGGDVQFRFGDKYLPFVIEDLATSMMGEDPFPDTPGLAASINAAEWNGWGHMSKKDCAEELEEYAGYTPDDPNDLGSWVVAWLRESKAADKDLIGFWGG